ncbi:DNA-binding MarR family transcriptional regulator [Agromyces hippuratus]|uniref:DNA-binding MarR family transcriptional regulator n=1 Tax=Agromyces hippuratus TaxID=286438 RepID=A0A852WVP6_9MICO|nr:MarR family transcriptional regulator [Agromyces hippuratus]NYG22146.1 DNA-binding MarR family transcriptional regulator [Agromyces hippuratus]
MSEPTVPPAMPAEFGVYFALLEVSALVQRGVQGQLRDHGDLSFVQFQILAICGEDPSSPRSMTELADRLVHSKSGLTYQVGQLERAGLVVRVPSTRDERGVNVTLSPEGASLLERVLPGHVEVVRDVLVDALGDADRDELARLLGLVADHVRRRSPRPGRVSDSRDDQA